MEKEIRQQLEDELPNIEKFMEASGSLDKWSVEDFSRLITFLLKPFYPDTDFSFERVSSVDMGPAGLNTTYQLLWVSDGKACHVTFIQELDDFYYIKP